MTGPRRGGTVLEFFGAMLMGVGLMVMGLGGLCTLMTRSFTPFAAEILAIGAILIGVGVALGRLARRRDRSDSE